jgi:transcription initiation factor TFIID subunit 11
MSLVSGSQVSTALNTAPPKKKRGRKSKAEKAREQTPSVAGGRAPTTVSAASDGARGSKKGAGGGQGDDDDEDVDRQEVHVAATAQESTAEQKAEEHRLRGMLINAFTSDQFDRYENWRAAGLNKSAVKRVSTPPPTRAMKKLA